MELAKCGGYSSMSWPWLKRIMCTRLFVTCFVDMLSHAETDHHRQQTAKHVASGVREWWKYHILPSSVCCPSHCKHIMHPSNGTITMPIKYKSPSCSLVSSIICLIKCPFSVYIEYSKAMIYINQALYRRRYANSCAIIFPFLSRMRVMSSLTR